MENLAKFNPNAIKEEFHIACDGVAKFNNRKDVPTKASWGIIVYSKRTGFRWNYKYLGNVTNQVAEIVASYKALYACIHQNDSNIHIYTDSAYVVNTMTQNWAMKKNKKYWNMLITIIKELVHKNKNKIIWHHIKEFGVKSHDLDGMKIHELRNYHLGARLNRLSDIIANKAIK